MMFKKILFLSLAAFATACASQTTEEGTMGDEAEVNGATSYTLSADHQEKLSGSAKAGSAIEISYDLNRLPQCRGNVGGGGPGWTITGFYSENGGAAKTFDVSKLSSDGKGRVSSPATITPTQGGDLAFWFQVTSIFGCSEYDSALGANYHVKIDGPAPDATPTITFSEKGDPSVSGELVAGGKVKVHYEQARLDICESYQGGYPQYGISGTAQINKGQKVTFDTGRAENGQRVAVDATVDLTSAGDLALWFETSSVHGCHDFDSKSGANYHFTVK